MRMPFSMTYVSVFSLLLTTDHAMALLLPVMIATEPHPWVQTVIKNSLLARQLFPDGFTRNSKRTTGVVPQQAWNSKKKKAPPAEMLNIFRWKPQ